MKIPSLAVLMAMLSITQSALAADNDVLTSGLPVCLGCHGADGRPVNPETPILAGQQFYYLYVQLRDYQAGRRANPIMSGMVKGLSKDDMKALAQHFSEQPWPAIDSGADASKGAMGESSLEAGQCSQCHSTYQGDSRIPRLAGQQLAYLLQTMKDFKYKVRLNSAAKGSLMDSFSDDELEAMAHNLAAR